MEGNAMQCNAMQCGCGRRRCHGSRCPWAPTPRPTYTYTCTFIYLQVHVGADAPSDVREAALLREAVGAASGGRLQVGVHVRVAFAQVALRREGLDYEGLHALPSNITRDAPPITRD